MQTFLPKPVYTECAKILDYKRLGKQRVEGLQILRGLLGISDGWKHHPVMKMWRGSEYWLHAYTLAMCNEWIARGYKDTCKETLLNLLDMINLNKPNHVMYPRWADNVELYASHRSNLIRKDPLFYSQYNWCESYDLPYVWPDNDLIPISFSTSPCAEIKL